MNHTYSECELCWMTLVDGEVCECEAARMAREIIALKASLKIATDALEAIKSEVGTSTLAHKIAREALKAPSEKESGTP